MRVFAITPIYVGPEEVARRQARYDRLSSGSVGIELHDLAADAPTSLDTAESVRESERRVLAAIADADLSAYDAVLPDCVLDPAVAELSGELPIPVFGLLRLCAGVLAGSGTPFAAVTRTAPIADELADRLRIYGLDGGFGGTEVLGVGVGTIADDAGWADALAGAVGTLAGRGARTVVNGCSAVDLDDAARLPARVVDPTELALRVLEIAFPMALVAG